MAIDTRAKRTTIMGMFVPFRSVLPIASGTVDQAARQTFLNGYSGILWGEPGGDAEIFSADSYFDTTVTANSFFNETLNANSYFED